MGVAEGLCYLHRTSLSHHAKTSLAEKFTTSVGSSSSSSSSSSSGGGGGSNSSRGGDNGPYANILRSTGGSGGGGSGSSGSSSGSGQPLYHRDVRSATILITDNHRPLLIGCGLSKYIHNNSPPRPDVKVTWWQGWWKYLTTPRFGTREYMCPEYLSTGHYDGRAEVYSFGLVLAGMLPYPLSSHYTDITTHYLTRFSPLSYSDHFLLLLPPEQSY